MLLLGCLNAPCVSVEVLHVWIVGASGGFWGVLYVKVYVLHYSTPRHASACGYLLQDMIIAHMCYIGFGCRYQLVTQCQRLCCELVMYGLML